MNEESDRSSSKTGNNMTGMTWQGIGIPFPVMVPTPPMVVPIPPMIIPPLMTPPVMVPVPPLIMPGPMVAVPIMMSAPRQAQADSRLGERRPAEATDYSSVPVYVPGSSPNG